MAYDDFETMRVTSEGPVVRAVIDHPPVNLLDLQLMLELDRLGRSVEDDSEAKVLVLSSADPEFFIAHADVNLILGIPREDRSAPNDALGFFHAMVDRFRTMSKASIAVIEGRVRGGGSELFSRTLLEPETMRRIERFLEIGGQTREVEFDLTPLYNKLS